MSIVGNWQKPVVMPTYPHMMDEDTAVWSKYLADQVVRLKAVWYDVKVGQPVQPTDPIDKMAVSIARGLTRKRIDVVVQVGGGYWVVEVKPVANYVALGQVISYRRLFIEEYRPDGDVIAVIVCNEVDSDVFEDFEASGVGLITVS